jgi:histidine ammonia-lyase
LLTGTYWLDIRKIQTPGRDFGPGPDAVWTEFRKIVPFLQDPPDRPLRPIGRIAYEFVKANPAAKFYPAGPAMPGGD